MKLSDLFARLNAAGDLQSFQVYLAAPDQDGPLPALPPVLPTVPFPAMRPAVPTVEARLSLRWPASTSGERPKKSGFW
jgi:hypothetical protein